VLHGQDALEVASDGCTFEEALGHGGGAVAQGHQPDPEVAQGPDAGCDVRMHLQPTEASHDVADRFLSVVLEGQIVERDPKVLGGDADETRRWHRQR
jgi:hypothetical protein